MIKVYQVNWSVSDGGQYVPPDPVCGGGWYSDQYGSDIIPATSMKIARSIIEKARPQAVVGAIKMLAIVPCCKCERQRG
jgi:hypothetical protein